MGFEITRHPNIILGLAALNLAALAGTQVMSCSVSHEYAEACAVLAWMLQDGVIDHERIAAEYSRRTEAPGAIVGRYLIRNPRDKVRHTFQLVSCFLGANTILLFFFWTSLRRRADRATEPPG